MKVLVIGGSYFLGRVFTMFAHEKFELTLVNRGNYSMKQMGIQEYHFDRHDQDAWASFPKEDYDAVVDFCAYQQGDIKTVVEHFQGKIKQYILISTVDVYKRQTGLYKDETHALETRHFGGEIGEYINQKILLEKELQEYQIPYTILRPGNIYGPFNYAPRESELIKRIAQGLPLFDIIDAQAKFQLVYVKDVANAIMLCIEKKVYNKTYNIISDELLCYDDINNVFKACHPFVEIEEHTIQESMQLQYPLIYPIMKEEEELYSGQRICQELNFTYTPFKEGMMKTYQAFIPIYQQEKAIK